MRRLLLFLFFFCWMSASYGQSEESYPKWHFKPAFGFHVPVSNLLSGEITDNLVEFEDQTFYGQLISGSYFFSRDWGIDLTFQMGALPNVRGKAQRFLDEMDVIYSEKYFVNASTGASYGNGALGSGLSRISFGLVRRIEIAKWMLIPQISVGVTSFYANWGIATLKERNSNTLLQVSYQPSDRPNDFFTFSSALSIGYRINENFIVNLDAKYGVFKSNLSFKKETLNLFTDELISHSFEYKRQVQTLSFGFGLIYEFEKIFKSDY